MLLYRKNNFLSKVRMPHYINCLIFCIAGGSYLLISNVDHLQPPREEIVNVSADYGVDMLFLTASVSIVTLLHYLFLKRFNHLDPMMLLGVAALGKALAELGRSQQTAQKQDNSGHAVPTDLAELIKQKERLEAELMKRNNEMEQLGVKLIKKKEKVKRLQSSFHDIEIKSKPANSYQEEEILASRTPEGKAERFERGISIDSGKRSEIDIRPTQKFEEVEFVISPHSKEEVETLRIEYGELQEKYLKEAREWKSQESILQNQLLDLKSQLKKVLEQKTQSDSNFTNLSDEIELYKLEAERKLEEADRLSRLLETLRSHIVERDSRIEELTRTCETQDENIKNLSLKLNELYTSQISLRQELDDTNKERDEIRREKMVREDELLIVNNQYALLRKELMDIQNKLKSDLEKESISFRNSVAEAEFETVQIERDSLLERIHHLNDLIKKQRESYNETTAKLNDMEMTKEEISLKLNQVSENYDKTKDMLKDARIQIENLKCIQEEKQQLESKVKEYHTLIERGKQNLRELQNTHAELMNTKEERDLLEAKVRELENALDKNRLMNKELQGQVTELTQDKEEKLQLHSKVQDLLNTLNKNRLTNKELQSQVTELTQDKQEKIHLQAKVQELENALEASRQLIKGLQSQSGDSTTLELVNSELSQKVVDLESTLHKNKQLFKDFKSKQSDYSIIKEENKDLKDELNNLKDALDRTRQLNKEFRDQLAKYERNQEQLDTLIDENARLSSLNKRMKSENENYKLKLSKELGDWEDIKTGLELENHKLRKEVEQVKYRLQNTTDDLEAELNDANKELETLKDNLQVSKNQYEITHRELERAKHMTEALQHELQERESKISEISQGEVLISSSQERISKILEKQIEDLHLNLKHSEGRLENTVKEKEELRNELNKKQEELNTVSEECMELHRELFEVKDKPSFSMARSSRESSLRSEISERSVRNIQDQIIIESMNEVDMNKNPLIRNVSKLKREPPMTYSNVWKLFENLMQEKCKLDRLEISLGRQPRTMTEFMLDFVYLHYGLKTLALKQLKALIASLEELYKMGHPYGILFCRFLGLFHPRPLPDHLSVYLLIVQEQFNFLISKVKSKKSSTYSQHYEILQFGGEAGIIDVMELVMKICKSRREAGERIISSLHRDSEDRLEVLMIKVCGTMARMGMNADYIFEVLDMDGGGTLDYHEFVDGIRFSLNIWVTEEEVEDLCSFIDDESTGFVTKEEWIRKVNFVEYAEKIYSKMAMVTKADFLTTLVDEYENQIIQDYYNLRQMIKISVLNQSSFQSTITQLDPAIDEGELFRLWEEARQHDRETTVGVTAEALCVVVLKNRVGGYGTGMFDINLLDASLPKSSTEGVRTELVVERSSAGRLEVSLQRKSS